MLIAEHYKYYFRVFVPFYGVGNDLSSYLKRRHDNPDKGLAAVLQTLLWRYTEWQLALARMTEELGGNWIASTAEAEDILVNSEYTAKLLIPISEHEESKLRLALRRADDELVQFEAEVDKPLHQRLVRRLAKWADRCDCNPRRPKYKSCEPHQTVRASRDFAITLEREWYRLSDWYHLPPETVSAERDVTGEYYFRADQRNHDLRLLDDAGQKFIN